MSPFAVHGRHILGKEIKLEKNWHVKHIFGHPESMKNNSILAWFLSLKWKKGGKKNLLNLRVIHQNMSHYLTELQERK